MALDRSLFQTLLSDASDGDEQALVRIIEMYEPEIRRTARALLGPALHHMVDSTDITQSIHRSILWHIRKEDLRITTPDHLRALALTMVRRKIARHWRKRRREMAANDQFAAEIDQTRRVTNEELDPATAAQSLDAIEHVLGRLSENDRKLIELRLLGHSTAEAARQLGLDSDVLRVRLSRLRQRLRTQAGTDTWI